MKQITPWCDRTEVRLIPEDIDWNDSHQAIVDKAKADEIKELRAALTAAQQAQPEPFTTGELVLMNEGHVHAKKFGLGQQAQPERGPLSDVEMWALWNSQGSDEMNQQEAIAFARAIEAAHGIKQGGQHDYAA